MTPEELTELERLEREATGGPWYTVGEISRLKFKLKAWEKDNQNLENALKKVQDELQWAHAVKNPGVIQLLSELPTNANDCPCNLCTKRDGER